MFFGYQTLIGLYTHDFRGVILLAFLDFTRFPKPILRYNSSKKLGPDHQMLKVRPFQYHRLRGKKRFDGLKNFGAPKMKKI